MSTTIDWEGHRIEITRRHSSRYFFFAGETILKVDGDEIAHSGGFHLTELATGSFQHDSEKSQIQVKTHGSLFPFSVKYVLRVNGTVVSQGKIGIEKKGIALSVLVWALLGVLIGFLLGSCILAKLG